MFWHNCLKGRVFTSDRGLKVNGTGYRKLGNLLDSTILIALALAATWLFIASMVVAACRMAARSDAEDASPSHSPRRPTTCGTVRKRILRSPHRDQLATYK